LAKRNLVKSLLFSALDKVIYYKGDFLQDSTKPLLTTQNRLETSLKKFALFSTCVFKYVLRFLCTDVAVREREKATEINRQNEREKENERKIVLAINCCI
jgi:hypothetical protein